MKQYAFIIILCILSGQKLHAENYIEYQKEITKAENLMFDSLFVESLKQYRKTLDAYSFNFPRDCMIAAQVAAYVGDDTSTFYFLRKAVTFGTTFERMRWIRLLYKPFGNEPLRKAFFHDYDSLRQIYSASINLPYRDICIQYKLKELELRNKDQAFFSNRYFVCRPFLRKKWMSCCKEVLTAMDSLIPKYGFPSYKTIGVTDSVTLSNMALTGADILSIYYHYVCQKNRTWDMSNLYDEVVKGNLSARDYATLQEFDLRSQKGYKWGKSLYYVRWEVPPRPNETYPNEELANQYRAAIGLSTCYYERVRKLWQHNCYDHKENSFELFYYEF